MKSASMYVERVDMSLICSFSFLLCLFGPLVNVNVNVNDTGSWLEYIEEGILGKS